MLPLWGAQGSDTYVQPHARAVDGADSPHCRSDGRADRDANQCADRRTDSTTHGSSDRYASADDGRSSPGGHRTGGQL